MFYRLRRALKIREFDRAIAGILETSPLTLQDAPWCIVSMVANRDVPMYLTAMKSFYPKIGRGKIVAIIDRDMPQSHRDTLARHLMGIELVILEDIATDPCQRGGTWERLLYCLDRSQAEYTIQLDSDTLVVSDDLDEVVGCLEANRAFTMSDGFVRVTLPEAAELAQATPSNYIGIVAEATFDRYPGAETLHYVRGSSGFAGFAKGGYTRAAISVFHEKMEALVGKARWREWGSEQCGSNFAVANSPDPLVLPYPEYASFTERVLRHKAKLFHFIGAFRFKEGYFARRSLEVIAALTPGAAPVAPPQQTAVATRDGLPLLFARSLTPGSFAKYIRWRIAGRTQPVIVQMRARTEFRRDPGPGPRFHLRAPGTGNNDLGVAYEIFILRLLMPPVWIPPERVKLVVDLGANVGMSCLWWLASYWRTQVIAFEPHPGHAAQARANIALNGYGPRIDLRQAAVGPELTTAWISDEGSSSNLSTPSGSGFEVEVLDLFTILAGRRVDILKIDIEGSEVGLLDDPRFDGLDVGAIAMEWHPADATGRGGRDWCIGRLEGLSFRTYVTYVEGACGIVWGYRDRGSK
jgi:FkbM family methyltransferase